MENRGTLTHMPPKLTNEIVSAAIEGFEHQKARIDTKISELRAMLDGDSSGTAAAPEAPTRKRVSAAARRRMALGQKARWAKLKGEPPAPAPPEATKHKRKLSAAGRAAIVAATKKRWASVHKAEKSAAKKAPAKVKMSPARKAALVASLAKARAARAAKRAAA
jgi:hypothetical protein